MRQGMNTPTVHHMAREGRTWTRKYGETCGIVAEGETRESKQHAPVDRSSETKCATTKIARPDAAQGDWQDAFAQDKHQRKSLRPPPDELMYNGKGKSNDGQQDPTERKHNETLMGATPRHWVRHKGHNAGA